MSDSDVYLPWKNSTESCDTSHSSSREETEVARTVQPFDQPQPRASNEDFDEDWQRRFLTCGVQVKIGAKNSCYWIFGLLLSCFVLSGEIYVKNG